MTDLPVLYALNLTKSFGTTLALGGLDVEIHSGEITAILGSNGAGKTTFIRCALGLTKPDGGTLKVFGGRPGDLSVRRRIGAMLQASDLPDLLSAREHIALFSSYYKDPIPTIELLSICQLEAFADKPYKALSGGQKRRVQFALSIVGKPDMVFLDEPTTGLDSDARRRLWETVRALSDRGMSVVLTTHYLEEADALADRILILQDGKAIAGGTPEQIRGAAGGAIIRCVTDISFDVLAKLGGVQRVQRSGRFVELVTLSAPESLKALFVHDPHLADLTVSKPDLDDALRTFAQMSAEEV